MFSSQLVFHSLVGRNTVGRCGDGGLDVPPGFPVNGKCQISSALQDVRSKRVGPNSLRGLNKSE